MVQCSAFGCSNRSGDPLKKVQYFRYPRQLSLRKVWQAKVKRLSWEPTDHSRLCEAHFQDTCFQTFPSGKRGLKADAIPTLFSFRTNSSPKKRLKPHLSLLDIRASNQKAVIKDHNYCKKDGAGIEPLVTEDIQEHLTILDAQDFLLLKENEINEESTVEITTTEHYIHELEMKLEESKNKLRQQELEINELKKEFQETRMPKSSLMKEKDDEVRYLQRGTMRGASWSKNTIKKALKIRFSCGAAGYGVLQDLGYPLPSKRTLRWRTEDIHFESGVLHEVFEMLRIKSSTMQPNDRLCGLTMDEMALKPSFDYDLKSDSFIGNVTLPNHSGRATKALVFQICGITARWKQTVAYFYTSGSVDGSVIGPIVKDIVTRSHEVGLEVINLTADMGSSNLACFN